MIVFTNDDWIDKNDQRDKDQCALIDWQAAKIASLESMVEAGNVVEDELTDEINRLEHKYAMLLLYLQIR